MIEKFYFANALATATTAAVVYARPLVINMMPTQYRYISRSWASAIDAQSVVTQLWNNGSIPIWIDIFVEAVDSHWTFIRIDCSSKLTGDIKRLRHKGGGHPPFQVCGPTLSREASHIAMSGSHERSQIDISNQERTKVRRSLRNEKPATA
jgi:hypothetical protein